MWFVFLECLLPTCPFVLVLIWDDLLLDWDLGTSAVSGTHPFDSSSSQFTTSYKQIEYMLCTYAQKKNIKLLNEVEIVGLSLYAAQKYFRL